MYVDMKIKGTCTNRVPLDGDGVFFHLAGRGMCMYHVFDGYPPVSR